MGVMKGFDQEMPAEVVLPSGHVVMAEYVMYPTKPKSILVFYPADPLLHPEHDFKINGRCRTIRFTRVAKKKKEKAVLRNIWR